MASKVLDVLLQLTVKGTPEAAKLEEAVKQLRAAIKAVADGKALDDILNGTRASAEVQKVTDRVKALQDWLLANRKAATDFRIAMETAGNRAAAAFEKAQTVAIKMNEALDRIAQKKIDIETSKASAALAKISLEANNTFNALQRLGKPVDFNPVTGQVAKLSQGLTGLRTQLGSTGQETERLKGGIAGLKDSAENAGREFLLLRRLLFGLGIISAVDNILELVKAFDKAKQSLRAVFGETKAKEEFEFIRVEAERLGLSVTELAVQYGKFSIASRSLGLTQQETRDVFLSVAEAGAQLSLSSEEVAGALQALQQIASKGRLSMEELRQQLGDRLPGALAISAKALGVTEAKLFALVEQGKVASDVFLRKFPAALRESFNTSATTRIETTAAQIERFKNALKELIDTAVRAGALELFVNIVKDLTNSLRSKEWLDNLKSFLGLIVSIGNAVKEHSTGIKLLLEGLIAFKLLGFLSSTLTAAAVGFTQLAGALGLTATAAKVTGPALTGLNSGVAGLSTALAATGPKIAGFNVGLAGLNAGLVIAVATFLVAKGIVSELTDIFEKAQVKAIALAEAQAGVGIAGKAAPALLEQISLLEQYSHVIVLSTEDIKKLGPEALRSYNTAIEGAKKLADTQKEGARVLLVSLEAERQALLLSGQDTKEARDRLSALTIEISKIKDLQAEFTANADKFNDAIARTGKVSQDSGVAVGELAVRMAEVAKKIIVVKEATQELNKDLKKITIDKLSDDAKAIATSLEAAIEKGDALAESIRKALPKNFLDGRVKEINDVGNALAALVNKGVIPLNEAIDDLAKALDKLTGNELNAFGINAKASFEAGALSAEAFALVLEAQLRAALKNLGLDAETAGKKVSKAFGELISNFSVIAQNAKASGDQIKGALDVAIAAAKTKEELLLIKATIEQLGLATGKFGDKLADSLLRLDDALRLVQGKLDSALGDSFKRLGITAKSELKGIADQAVVDFDRIKASGQATTLELEAAWRKMAEEVTKLNNGIPPINILIKAVDFNAFDLIVKAAEDATVRTRKAIENAIPLVETVKQARALGDAIKEAFDKGKISAEEFGKLITQVGFQLRELAAKPVGEVAAAAELLGLKTKDQLKAVSDNAKEAFQIISTSGQFTNEQLAKGAQQFLDAYTAANSGVVDSFDPVVAKALEVIDAVKGTNSELDKMKAKTDAIVSMGGPDLGKMPVQELQQLLTDTIKAYRNIGVSNVEQLQIIKDINAELQRKAIESTELMKKRLEDSANALEKGASNISEAVSSAPNAGGGGAVIPGGGGTTNNFNFNGANLTADEVQRKIIPVLNTIAQRKR